MELRDFFPGLILNIWLLVCGIFSGPFLGTLFLGTIDTNTALRFLLGILGVLLLSRIMGKENRKNIMNVGFGFSFLVGFAVSFKWIGKRFWETYSCLRVLLHPALEK